MTCGKRYGKRRELVCRRDVGHSGQHSILRTLGDLRKPLRSDSGGAPDADGGEGHGPVAAEDVVSARPGGGGEPPCVGCHGDHTGEDIVVNDDCPQHGYEEPEEQHLGSCPWYLTRGLPDSQRKRCSFGCWSEPACETNEPDGGWPAPDLSPSELATVARFDAAPDPICDCCDGAGQVCAVPVGAAVGALIPCPLCAGTGDAA